LLRVIECIVFPLSADRYGEAVVDIEVSWRWWFVLVAGIAVLNNHHGVGDPGQKFTGGFAGFHRQIGKTLHYHLFIGLRSELALKSGLQICPC
jgi:hypothetical protein